MIKSIQLELLTINYGGVSIGDNIHVEIEISNRFLRIDRKIKVGKVIEVNKEIGSFETDKKIFKAKFRITVIEKDLLFNDSGTVDGTMEIDTSTSKPQQFSYEIRIRETRSVFERFSGKKTGNFTIIIGVKMTDAVRYIPNEDAGNGWLKVKFLNSKSIESLPAYVRIKFEQILNGREYFTALEGAYHGRSGSVTLKDDGSSHLISDIKHESMARVLYSISKKTLTLNGRVYTTVDYRNAPWKKGLYDIEIPDYPHPIGARYQKQAPRAKTWFKIGHSGERYLHTGGISLGCITVIEKARWAEIYDSLMKARKGDFMSVGVLEVVD